MAKEEKKGLLAEFKEFIEQGNVMDMAVGVIIGAAFTAIVTSFVDTIIRPIISIATGGQNPGEGLKFTVGSATIDIGAFLGAVINFLIIALVVFLMVKAVNKVSETAKALTKKQTKEAVVPTCPYCLLEIKEGATRCPHCTAELKKDKA